MSLSIPAAEPTDPTVPAPPDGLCLDFANTRYWRGSPQPTDTLAEPDDLRGWVIASCGWANLAWAADAAAFAAAIELRESIFRLFAASAAGTPVPADDLTRVNAALAEAPRRDRMAVWVKPAGWAVPRPPASVFDVLAPVLWSAGDLLLGPRAGRVRQCANPLCGFLFLDDSKSGNRRWCSMSSCGNRAKAHRHYLRQKGL